MLQAADVALAADSNQVLLPERLVSLDCCRMGMQHAGRLYYWTSVSPETLVGITPSFREAKQGFCYICGPVHPL